MHKSKFWRIYILEQDYELHWRSIKMEPDMDSEGWELLNTQIFQKDNEMYISCLFEITD